MSKWAVEGGKKCHTKCSHIEDAPKSKIVLSNDLWHVIQAMCLKFPTREWQMMLTGRVQEKGVYLDGYIIPKQATSAAYVEHKDDVTAEMIAEKHILCGIHSHVNMATNPSSVDIEDSVMSLIDYHIIVNNKSEVNGMQKVHLPCGGLTIAQAEVLVAGLVDLTKIEIVGLENITERTFATPAGTPLFASSTRGYEDFYGKDYYGKDFYYDRTENKNTAPVIAEYWLNYTVQEEAAMATNLMKGVLA